MQVSSCATLNNTKPLVRPKPDSKIHASDAFMEQILTERDNVSASLMEEIRGQAWSDPVIKEADVQVKHIQKGGLKGGAKGVGMKGKGRGKAMPAKGGGKAMPAKGGGKSLPAKGGGKSLPAKGGGKSLPAKGGGKSRAVKGAKGPPARKLEIVSLPGTKGGAKGGRGSGSVRSRVKSYEQGNVMGAEGMLSSSLHEKNACFGWNAAPEKEIQTRIEKEFPPLSLKDGLDGKAEHPLRVLSTRLNQARKVRQVKLPGEKGTTWAKFKKLPDIYRGIAKGLRQEPLTPIMRGKDYSKEAGVTYP